MYPQLTLVLSPPSLISLLFKQIQEMQRKNRVRPSTASPRRTAGGGNNNIQGSPGGRDGVRALAAGRRSNSRSSPSRQYNDTMVRPMTAPHSRQAGHGKPTVESLVIESNSNSMMTVGWQSDEEPVTSPSLRDMEGGGIAMADGHPEALSNNSVPPAAIAPASKVSARPAESSSSVRVPTARNIIDDLVYETVGGGDS